MSNDQLPNGLSELASYPLVQAIANRRSRRFATGFNIAGGGLEYQSKLEPQPLSELENAVLAFAAAGINGIVLGDFPYDSGTDERLGGNVMATMTGRSAASADAVHGAAVFMTNDEGTYFLKRPQDFTIEEVDELGQMGREGRYLEIYDRMKVRIADGRVGVQRDVPWLFPFNKWSTNLPGTSYFLPMSEMTGMYINVLLSAFDEANAYFVVDDRNNFLPAGLKKFGARKGGALKDDPDSGHVFPIQAFESVVLQFVFAEQAFIGHNLSLMEQAMGLGGWTHFASPTETGWAEALGFRTGQQSVSQKLRAGLLKRLVLRLLRMDKSYPYALGITAKDGTHLVKPWCPPYYKSMEEAVLAFVEYKRSSVNEVPLKPGFAGTWKDPVKVQKTVPPFTDACIDATVAYCTYVYETYGRFPSYFGPTHSTLAHQAHHLDLSFYDEYYNPGAYTETQARHQELWH